MAIDALTVKISMATVSENMAMAFGTVLLSCLKAEFVRSQFNGRHLEFTTSATIRHLRLQH